MALIYFLTNFTKLVENLPYRLDWTFLGILAQYFCCKHELCCSLDNDNFFWKEEAQAIIKVDSILNLVTELLSWCFHLVVVLFFFFIKQVDNSLIQLPFSVCCHLIKVIGGPFRSINFQVVNFFFFALRRSNL